MKTMIPMAGALALALAAPMAADAQDHGRGQGKGHEARGNSPARPDARPDVGRKVEREIARVEQRVERELRPAGPDVRAAVTRRSPQRGLIAGCPPGLARKDNGCLPPGQARKIERASARYDYLWNRGAAGERNRYEDGYLLRSDARGNLLGYLPMLGGALSPGAAWPAQYPYEAAPDYLKTYFGLGDQYNYRAADGVLYGVDPQTQAIGQVAALLTGQQWNVGQTMPAGYDVYNLPQDYRARYPDTAEQMYRYDDGQVYQVDPATRVVQAVIQLLS